MPRLDYRAMPETTLRLAEVQLVFALLLDEINQLRQWANQPPLSQDDVQARLRQYLQAHPELHRPVEGF